MSSNDVFVHQPTASRPRTTAPGRTGRIAGLDGVRALAVVAVLAYHADIGWAKGGFLGVDVFFVLSGYLMGTITIDAVSRHGGLDLKRFWAGRFRRLMPSQVALMVFFTLLVALFYREELYDLRGQVIAGLTATMNWFLIATEGSYFEQLGRPPLLRHLWSLAIEMQFYLVFPPALAALASRGRFRRDQLAMGLVGLAALSAIWMAILVDPNGDPSRAYFDTFARLMAPLLGAALALIWQPQRIRHAPIMAAGPRVFGAGLVALAGLALMVTKVDDRDLWMYRGGFLLAAVLSVVVLAAITHPGSPLGSSKLLGHRWLVAVGLRSYCIYLWHWPVFALLRPRVDVSWSWTVTFIVRIVVTLVLAELCYRLVERPWHLRSPSTSSAAIFRRGPTRAERGSPLPSAKATAVAAIAVAVVALVLAKPAVDPIAESLQAGNAALTSTPPVETTPDGDPVTTTPDDPTATTIPAAPGTVTFVGDSVMLGAAPVLLERFGEGTVVNAEVSRQATAYPGALQALAAAGPLGSKVVVQVGNNGTVTDEELEAIAEAAGDADLYFLTVRVPRSWEGDVNQTLRDHAEDLGATVIDWRGRSEGQLAWFYDDGIHLNQTGQQAYADVIEQTIGA
ncbi:MAG: acyltransferase [Acidimicrobiales bacterium]|nr:acyltransferase [Acidimicrobiales bacterium]